MQDSQPGFSSREFVNPQQTETLLNVSTISDLLKQAGVSLNIENGKLRPQAEVYRSIIWQLASIYGERHNIFAEITHAEYFPRENINAVDVLDFCLFFCDQSGHYQAYDNFRNFLAKNAGLIPEEFRQKFDVYIGFDYRNNGAILIEDVELIVVNQNEYDRILDRPNRRRLGYSDPENYLGFEVLLAEKIRQLIKVSEN